MAPHTDQSNADQREFVVPNFGSVEDPKGGDDKALAVKSEEPATPAAPPATPLPKAALAAIGVALFTNSLIITVLFPFTPLVVTTFGVTEDESEIGYYAGMLASCFFLGSLISGPIWGHISDIIGRKTVMLIGLVGNMVFSLVFGFSVNFPMAVGSRFLLGLICTVLVVSKTSITEICDDTNVAQGFSVYGLCWGLGLITGPLVGGFLVQPAVQYPWLFSANGIFGIYPFLLPNLVLAILTVFGFVLCLVYLQETLGKVTAAPGHSQGSSPTKAGKDQDGKKTIDFTDAKLEEGKNGKMVNGQDEEEDEGLIAALFYNQETMMTLAILCIAGFMFTSFEELFPLWAETSWEYGGLDFTTSNVGLAQGTSGLALIPVTLILYPWLINKLGAIGALQLSLFTGVFQAFIPYVRIFGFNKVVLQVACMVIFAIRSFNETGMAAMFILFNNSIRQPKYLGVLNGAQTTGLSTFQALAPWSIGSIFAWSIGVNKFPIDYHLAWFFLGFMHLVALVMTLYLPKEVNHRKMVASERGPNLH